MEAQDVLNNLLKLYHEQKMAHAYLIETNNIDKCYEDILVFIKKMICNYEYNKECNKCNLCNLIDNKNLPNLMTIEPINKTITKDMIDNLKLVFKNKPLFINNNIYIIKNPELMNSTSFNKMLKFIEEPEEDILGFLITNNKDDVASTVVSRCEILKIYYNNNDNSYDEQLYKLAKEYINKIELGEKDLVWYNNSVILEKLPNRIDIINFFKILLEIYEKDVNIIYNQKQINLIISYLNKLQYNVNTSLLLDSFSLEMGNINESI